MPNLLEADRIAWVYSKCQPPFSLSMPFALILLDPLKSYASRGPQLVWGELAAAPLSHCAQPYKCFCPISFDALRRCSRIWAVSRRKSLRGCVIFDIILKGISVPWGHYDTPMVFNVHLCVCGLLYTHFLY